MSIDREWVKKMWYIYTMEYYSAFKKNGIGIGGRLGRSREEGGRSHPGGVGEERRAIAPPTQAGETAELPGQSPALQGPLQAMWVLGGIGRRPGGE